MDKKKKVYDLEMSDKDIYEAMKDIPGYLDITPSDFKELYSLTYRHAMKRMAESIKAGDIMTADVIAVKKETPLIDVARLMAEHGVSGVPVVDEAERVAGIISERDFLFRMGARDKKTFMDVVAACLKGKGCVALSIRAKNAEDIMTSPVVTVSNEATLLEIASIFMKKNINRVPVVDSEGSLSGIVSRGDMIETPFLLGLS